MNALLLLGALALLAKVATKPKGIPGRWYVRAIVAPQKATDEEPIDLVDQLVKAFYDGELSAIYEPLAVPGKAGNYEFAVELAGDKPPGKGLLSVPGGTLKILESRPLKLSEDESRDTDRTLGSITVRKW